ncbi:hypothetical protein J2810_004634 [Chryseobacterium rhizosphaerae]|uniref:hypothetical protein n=1 Tax=Chryseobacterium rhizosphaerae TaxID=395937 RepID=UPI0028549BE3|nr:hypothetical protein [Chryseobacterium rhizosphaerae]MDR6548544.1 hypothetical protein [Chryseobacterium rhizosphaerae]
MALLRVRIKGKVLIVWGTLRLNFIRNQNNIVDSSISFSSGTGQTFTADQVLFTIGTAGTAGFFQVRSKDNVTLSGTGVFPIRVEHFPTSTAVPYTQNYTIDGSATSIFADYNSKPQINSVIVETDYNVPYTFQGTDFTSQFTDYDSDSLYDLRINGDVTGYTYDAVAYVAGTWIPLSHVESGRLQYVPTGQTDSYEKDNTWDGRDSNGNISTDI